MLGFTCTQVAACGRLDSQDSWAEIFSLIWYDLHIDIDIDIGIEIKIYIKIYINIDIDVDIDVDIDIEIEIDSYIDIEMIKSTCKWTNSVT